MAQLIRNTLGQFIIGHSDISNNIGLKRSNETRKKQSLIKIGKPSNKLGKKCSEETKKKISLANIGKKRTYETKKKLSEAHKGKKCHWWKGGISKLKIYKHYNNLEYKEWRKKVFERDNYTCRECGARSSKKNKVIIHPHHIKSYTYYPKLRYIIDNGVTLCIHCHHKLHFKH